MNRKAAGVIVALGVTAVAVIAVVTGVPFGGTPSVPVANKLTVDHGPEPILRSQWDGDWTAHANFWASDAETTPDGLSFSVAVTNARDLAEKPSVTSSSEVRDDRRWVSVALDFPHGSMKAHPSIDLTVTFTNSAGRSASKTMTIDEN